MNHVRLILILYEDLRVLLIYTLLRKAELVRKEEALYLRFFTQELKSRKFGFHAVKMSVSTNQLH